VSELMLQLLNVFEKFLLDVFRHRKSSVAARGEGRSRNGDVRAAAGVLIIIREGGKWGVREGIWKGGCGWKSFGLCGLVGGWRGGCGLEMPSSQDSDRPADERLEIPGQPAGGRAAAPALLAAAGTVRMAALG
jgi:hypothetical protein